MNRQQNPGRVEALRAVLSTGVKNSTPDMLNMAGFNRPILRAPAAPSFGVVTFTSGVEKLSQKERTALPF